MINLHFSRQGSQNVYLIVLSPNTLSNLHWNGKYVGLFKSFNFVKPWFSNFQKIIDFSNKIQILNAYFLFLEKKNSMAYQNP